MSQSSGADQHPDEWFPMSNVWNQKRMASLLVNQEIVPYILRGHWEAKGEKRKFIHAIVDGDPNKIQAATKDPKHSGETIAGFLTIQRGLLVFTPSDLVPKPPRPSKVSRRSESSALGSTFPTPPPNPATDETNAKANVPLKLEDKKPKRAWLGRLGLGKKS